MLEVRRDAIEEQVQQKIRAFRDTASAETTRPPAGDAEVFTSGQACAPERMPR
jgi:hypothetical protein